MPTNEDISKGMERALERSAGLLSEEVLDGESSRYEAFVHMHGDIEGEISLVYSITELCSGGGVLLASEAVSDGDFFEGADSGIIGRTVSGAVSTLDADGEGEAVFCCGVSYSVFDGGSEKGRLEKRSMVVVGSGGNVSVRDGGWVIR